MDGIRLGRGQFLLEYFEGLLAAIVPDERRAGLYKANQQLIAMST